MAAAEPALAESVGAQLNYVLTCHRKFLENVFSLMRFLEVEATRPERGWDMVKNGGYAVTRDGFGSSLTTFATAEWSPTQIGIGFVRAGLATLVSGVTNTEVPEDGLEVLYFQVRWLDKSPGEPMVWFGRLSASPDKSRSVKRKWEEYQSQVFKRMVSEAAPSDSAPGTLRQFNAGPSNALVAITGSYRAVPVVDLVNEQDVVSKLVVPAWDNNTV